MKPLRLLPLSLLALFISCPSKQPKFTFLEGPPRLVCRPEEFMATVGKPWVWSCIVEGDIKPYAEAPLGIQIVVKMREEFPTRSLSNSGLKRVYNYSTTFDEEYYADLMGQHRFRPEDDVELIHPTDPRYPMPPIDGLENAYDGSFWIEMGVFPIEYWNPATGEVVVGKRLMSDRINGRLNCPLCAA